MLFLYFNKNMIKPSLVVDVDKVFQKKSNDLWYYDDWTVDVIEDIDKAVVLPPKKIQHPIFGEGAPDRLSRYTKVMLLLKHNPDAVYRLSDVHCEQAARLLELSKTQHIHLLCDCCYSFDNAQVACVPEFDTKVTGNKAINLIYDSYLHKTYSSLNLKYMFKMKGEHSRV